MNGQKVFRGLSQTHGFGGYVAACAETSVSSEGALKVHRSVAATDPGYAVSPLPIEVQVEGRFAYSLTAMMYGEGTLKDGRVEHINFDSNPMMRMHEMPKAEPCSRPAAASWAGWASSRSPWPRWRLAVSAC